MRFELSGFDRLLEKLSVAEAEAEEAFKNASSVFIPQAQATVQNVLTKAAAQAGDDAFPIAYIEPMLSAAEKIIIREPTAVLLDFEELGTADDLQEGFHYGAKIEGGGQVELPYGGEPLKNDTAERYEEWQRVFHSET